MTSTVTLVGRPDVSGTRKTKTVDVDITSYTAAGEAFAAADAALRRLESVQVLGVSDNGYVVRWGSDKLRAYAPVFIDDNDSPAATTVSINAGETALEATNPSNADVYLAGVEVPATTDVGVVRLVCVGV